MKIEFGTKIIIYGYTEPAFVVSRAYGLVNYPNKILVSFGEEYKLRGLDLSKCVELHQGITYYDKIDFYIGKEYKYPLLYNVKTG